MNNDPEYCELYPRDIIKLKKLVAMVFISKNSVREYEQIRVSHEVMLNQINFFMNKLIDSEVIPIKETDLELKSVLFTFLQNHSDAMTLASGIQHHQQEEIKILTGDKKDWNKENIQWVYDSRPDLAKKYSKIPEIIYIQNM